MTKENWVDFKSIKAAVSMEMMLARYSVNWLRRKDDELRGRCPIHQGEGQDTFHVNVGKNVFNCFSCKKRGNVLDFVSAMEKCTVRDAGLKITEWFSVDGNAKQGSGAPTEKPAADPAEEKLPAVNKPLAFELKGVDPRHTYLQDRGISAETAEQFGVGFFSGKGSMSGRVVIPIHNERGELVAYSGRAIDGSEPKYKLPAGFHKSLELYNLHRAVEDNEPRVVVVVEGFFDCLKVYEAGYPSVALMGSTLSKQQEEQLVRNFRAAMVMMDGDAAGKTAAGEIVGRLAGRMFVRVIELAEGKQPDSMTKEELKGVLR
jgi:DNA primase